MLSNVPCQDTDNIDWPCIEWIATVSRFSTPALVKALLWLAACKMLWAGCWWTPLMFNETVYASSFTAQSHCLVRKEKTLRQTSRVQAIARKFGITIRRKHLRNVLTNAASNTLLHSLKRKEKITLSTSLLNIKSYTFFLMQYIFYDKRSYMKEGH